MYIYHFGRVNQYIEFKGKFRVKFILQDQFIFKVKCLQGNPAFRSTDSVKKRRENIDSYFFIWQLKFLLEKYWVSYNKIRYSCFWNHDTLPLL